MAPRRTLGNALEMTADKLAFIRQGPQLEGEEEREPLATSRREAPAATFLEVNQPRTVLPEPRPAAFDNGNPALRGEVLPSLLGEVLVPLTTRIRPLTANALRRAHLEQKLAGRLPATQQEIIEEALTVWLREHGFLVESHSR